MAFTYDVTTDRGKVRMLITDVESTDPCFDDDEIDAFLSMADSGVLLAAAMALETIASNEVLVLKVIKLLDLTTDGAKVSDALLKRAQLLRDQAASEAETFDIAEWASLNAFNFEQHVWNEALRDV
ncbi:MAG: hypothetical protein M0R06_25260 [Sphaerochaeta sp.]|nr:hypothetical protein [Sphaerochaeta sp.]